MVLGTSLVKCDLMGLKLSFLRADSVTILGDLSDLGQVFKAFGNN